MIASKVYIRCEKRLCQNHKKKKKRKRRTEIVRIEMVVELAFNGKMMKNKITTIHLTRTTYIERGGLAQEKRVHMANVRRYKFWLRMKFM